ncbi:hypothetical protein M422DRAFT_160910 [Sphaerobolus stellatus SS14]|nr:hypothetical protein M422DRAFT_160910 [Sphaerobolus stellatus SS14]
MQSIRPNKSNSVYSLIISRRRRNIPNIYQCQTRHNHLSSQSSQVVPDARAENGEGSSTISSLADSSPSNNSKKTTLPQVTDLLDVYRNMVAEGRLRYDENQIRAVMELRKLQKTLQDYSPPAFVPMARYSQDFGPRISDSNTQSTSEWWETIEELPGLEDKHLVRVKTHAEEIADLDTPKGLLLTGVPGSGKSMLIDLWFSILPTPYKVRKHYSTLVLEIYRGVWEETKRRQRFSMSDTTSFPQDTWNRKIRDRWNSFFRSGKFSWSQLGGPDLIGALPWPSISYCIAQRLLFRHWLLVFDEIQLLDVSSAGLLSDVLSWYWRLGGVVIGSSNKVPDELYRNGVQRERLEPFVEALKLRCPVHNMQGTLDYREIKAADRIGRTWFMKDQEKQFGETVTELLGRTEDTETLKVFGRILQVKTISNIACKFTFNELCNETLGPADYISIASRYTIVVLTGIPVIRTETKNQGRRLISLIDALYESRCRLIALSEADLDNLFFPESADDRYDHSNEDLMMAESVSEMKEAYRPNIVSYDATPAIESTIYSPKSLEVASLSIFSGEEERFAYRRAHSRLLEMTSRAYDEEYNWQPLPSELRQWERSTKAPDVKDTEDDLEARPALAAGRPSPKKIKDEHFWGVRDDWGPRAGKWGKGIQGFQDKEQS